MTDALPSHVAQPQPQPQAAARAETRDRIRGAGRILVVGLALGVLGQLLFYGVGLGLNVLLIVAALLLAAVRLRGQARSAPADAWLAPAALVLAAFAALRGDAALVAIDTLAALALTGAAIVALAGGTVMRRSAIGIAILGLAAALSALFAAPLVAAAARHDVPSGGRLHLGLGRGAPVVRGALIALPLVVVFTALFVSADAVFGRFVSDLLGALRTDLDLGELPGRLFVAVLMAWIATGALVFALAPQGASDTSAPSRLGGWLGTVEAVTVLVILDLLFAGFVVLQAAYLFGGLDTLAAAGLTYAEYAQRGFFELCAVAFLVGGLILVVEALIGSRSRAYVAAAAALVLLTVVVIASAALRLGLYQHAYGWTELRFYVAATIAWLAIGAVMTLGALVANRTRWLPHGLLFAALAVGIAINVIGPVRFIAAENVARAIDSSLVAPEGHAGLDAAYLGSLDADAIEPLVEALPHLPEQERRSVERVLDEWRSEPAISRADAWQEWNLGRARARELLRDLRER
jgi:hypothetical protein